MGAVLAVLVVAALCSAWRDGSASGFRGHMLPDLADPVLVKSFATMMFALAGLELAPMMGSEIRDARRTIPRAIVAAGTLVAAFYLLGTTALLIALPREDIGSIAGIADAVSAIAGRLGVPLLGPLLTLLMALASVGVLAAWVAGSARLPYAVGIDHHLPQALARLHPRWRTPHVALLTMGAITSILVVLALAGSSVGDAYQLLVDTTVVLTFVPIAYMFLALPVLRARRIGDGPLVLRVAGGRAGLAAVTALGLGSTLVAVGCALVPPAGAAAAVYLAKVLGGCAVFLLLGGVVFRLQARRSHAVQGPGRVRTSSGSGA